MTTLSIIENDGRWFFRVRPTIVYGVGGLNIFFESRSTGIEAWSMLLWWWRIGSLVCVLEASITIGVCVPRGLIQHTAVVVFPILWIVDMYTKVFEGCPHSGRYCFVFLLRVLQLERWRRPN